MGNFVVTLVMDNEKGIGNQETGVEEVVDVSMKEVGKILLAQTPGLVVIDNDFSLKTKEYELGLGGKEPGRIPEESAELLRKLRQSGWQVLVVSNQPKEGHQVARLIKKMKGAEYPIFPDTVKEIIGDGNVHGGGKDFLWNKYKDSRKAVEKTADWLVDHAQYVLGQVYFVGDRQSDVEFGRRVDKELKEKGFRRQVNTWKVKGLELPKPLKPLEKYIP